METAGYIQLANCIANADFNFPRGIVIKKDLYSLVIENYGSIIAGKAQMLKGGISEPRNKVIMKMFNLIHVGERAGSGVKTGRKKSERLKKDEIKKRKETILQLIIGLSEGSTKAGKWIVMNDSVQL